jgi:ATP-binding cassette subfamily B protein
MPKIPVFIQHDANDCGPTCLRIISKHYGKYYSLESLREKSFITHSGVSLLGISEAAESIGFRSRGLQLSYEQFSKDVILPSIVHWKQEHFIVVYKISGNKVYAVDPAFGKIIYPVKEFLQGWASSKSEGVLQGICLELEPGPSFYSAEDEHLDRSKLAFLLKYLKGYRTMFMQIMAGVLLGAVLQVIFPFLFQTIVDKGVIIPNPGLIVTILIAQVILVTSKFFLELIRNWIILHLGARVNIYLVSDFLIKVMRLPIAFFDSKNRGDLIQRVNDHKRIETFLTSTSINLFHSLFTITVMGIVLLIFNTRIFLIFLAGSGLYLAWTLQFMKRRKELDNRRFAQLSSNQNSLIQLFSGMHEIKLNNCDKKKRWDWENIQAKLFRINVKSLSLLQKQRAGALFFNEYKDIIIVFYTAILVLKGDITLGSMVAISYVVGQLSGPIDQMIEFMHSTQDARTSLERLSEIHNLSDEESEDKSVLRQLDNVEQDIIFESVAFQYEGPKSPFVLSDISFTIPQNKITAIVGTSGSGKTTLLKLLLKFYDPVAGDIRIGDVNIRNLSPTYWRNLCGAVMQDGYIFSDSIADNIAISNHTIDKERLYYAARMANVNTITDAIPMGYNAKVGPEGLGLSQGQKQRILIARAIYKDPTFLFFDEATNALDANNEKLIMANLQDFFIGRTVIIVAHRLSTVKNADQIIVLEAGKIVETGNHVTLTKSKGAYYNLVKNQLELGA